MSPLRATVEQRKFSGSPRKCKSNIYEVSNGLYRALTSISEYLRDEQ